jgi:hypothetical protein
MLSALAKLVAQRAALRKERKALDEEVVHANQFYEIVTQSTLYGEQYSASERREIDPLIVKREQLLKRVAQIKAVLKVIERDGAIIKKHCSATPEQIQAAIKTFQKRYHDAEALVLGVEFAREQMFKEAKASFRRLSVRARQRD